jgi:hypothetical protein
MIKKLMNIKNQNQDPKLKTTYNTIKNSLAFKKILKIIFFYIKMKIYFIDLDQLRFRSTRI